ncbi:MAG TPA: class II fructose-bisphosphate aldolase [Planctomycetota bacterium]|nr:class II fructose-bisphosphate aldolase [Planctomycetota bacterium]
MAFLDALKQYQAQRKAMLAANFYNAETLMAVLRAAKKVGGDIILQTSPSTLQYLGVDTACAMARAATREIGARAWLHLDHATDPALIHRCIALGWDSVMIDASEKSLDDNRRMTADIVKAAHVKNIAVEAELGYVPKLGQADATAAQYTDPREAADFVKATGVDLLAVAIGTAHGFYKTAPKLDLDRLAAIHAATPEPLVLHGGSGIEPKLWQEAIRRGIVKVNFATEIKDTFVRTLKQIFTGTDEIDIRKTFPGAMEAVTDLVAAKMRVCLMEQA